MNDQSLQGRQLVRRGKGEYFFRQSDRSRELYVVKSGRARVFKNEGSGEVDLDMVSPGGIFGEIAAIDGMGRSASVVAAEDTEAYCIASEEFQKISSGIPDWFQKIAAILVHRLRDVDSKINRAASGDWVAPVAQILTLFSQAQCGERINATTVLGLKYLENELMDILGMKLSDVTSTLQALEGLHMVSIEKGKVALIQPAKLAALGQTLFALPAESPIV